MKNSKSLILLLFYGVLPYLTPYVYSQNATPQLYFDHLTIYEGLSHNTASCLLQDQHGYVWIGTQNGLNKYDGYSLELFLSNGNEKGEDGFIGKRISTLFEDSKGNLWVGTSQQGVNVLRKDSGQFENLHDLDAFKDVFDYEVTSINEDQAGHIWFTTLGAGVLEYDPIKKTSKLFNNENSGLYSDTAFDLVQDKYGTIWVATAGKGLNFLQSNGWFFQSHVNIYQSPDMDGYRKKLLLDDEFLWIGTEGSGLYRMEIKTQDYKHFTQGNSSNNLNTNLVRAIYKTDDGKVFIATDGGGLNIYNPNDGQIEKHVSSSHNSASINSNAIFCFMEDRMNNLWMGTFDGGVNIYKANKTWFDIGSASIDNTLNHKSILALSLTRNDEIWIGTDGNGLYRLEEKEPHSSLELIDNETAYFKSLSDVVVKTVFQDSKGMMWIGLFGGGLDKYDPTSGEVTHYQTYDNESSSLSGNNIWSIAEQQDNKIWISPLGYGLDLYDPESNQFSVFRHDANDPNSLVEDNIIVVLVDSKNNLWAGSLSNGLDVYDRQKGHFIHHKQQTKDSFSISNNEIRAIYEDSKGQIWIGTEGGGLNKWLGDGQFLSYQQEDGLIDNNIMGIVEDDFGFIWVTTFKGISRFNTEDNSFRNFDFGSQQNNNQFNSTAILKTTNGRLFFGGINGLNSILPQQVRDVPVQAPLLFTDFRIFNQSIKAGKQNNGKLIFDAPIEDANEIQLSHTDNSFSIDFAVMDYSLSVENSIAYKMDGFNEDWQYTEKGKHTANYTNLDPGSYYFMIKQGEEQKSILIIINPPFWKTLWFKFLLILFSLVSIYLGMRFVLTRAEETHQQQLLEVEREVLKLKNENLQSEVEAKNAKLMFSTVQMAHKNEILSNIKEDLRSGEERPSNEMRKLLRLLDKELKNEDYWKEFNLYFEQADQKFIHTLIKRHPDLTQNDIRVCSLIKLNLSTKEIASLLNVSVRGVEQSRYRLKKRLGLGSKDDLLKYIALL